MAYWRPPTNYYPSPAPPPPPPPSARDLLQQELQNERIREEYVAREIAHSRLLLEQQLRHQRDLDYAVHRRPSVYPLPDHVERLPPSYGSHLSFRDADSVVARYATPVTPMLDDRVVGSKPVPDRRKAVAWNEGQMLKKISGMKRKAGKTGSELGLKEVHVQGKKHKAMEESKSVVDPKEQKNVFDCDVCKVKCKSHSNLKSHLHGKRHREEALTILENEIANSMLPSSENQKGAAERKPEFQHESKQKTAAQPNLGAQQETTVQQQKVQPQQSKRKPTGQQTQCFNCDVCLLKCNSLIMLNSHLNGKKHKEQLEEHNKVQDRVPISAEVDTKLANVKPATTGQSFYCEVCKLKCNSLSNMKSHLNGKRHKEESLASLTKEVDKVPTLLVKDQLPAIQQKLAIQQKVGSQQKPVVEQKEPFNCGVCNLKCNSLTMLNSHLNGKKHKAQLEERKKAQDGMPITAEVDVKLVNDKPATTLQSFHCDVCNCKCYMESTLNSHLNGKKHKARLKELNILAVSKPDTAEVHNPIAPAGDMNLANDTPVPAEQSVPDSHVTTEVSGKEENLF